MNNLNNNFKFNFATSFSFSLIEQLVGNNIWNDTTIGSVTLGLLQSFLNNETLEIFTSNSYIFIKRANDNTLLLFLDAKTGIVRDVFSFNGLLGTMPCYHDNVTERAWEYGHSFNNAMNIMEHIAGEIDNFLDWSNDDVLSIVGGCIITVGVAMFLVSNPIGWATLGAIGLIAVGDALIYYANDLNNGWSNERWLSFSIDLSLSIIPAGGMTTKIGKTILTKPLSKQTVTTLISKNSKNIPYELDLMSELGISGTIYKGYNTYILFGNGERIYYNAFGFTRYERMVNFIKDRIKDIFSDILINSYSNE